MKEESNLSQYLYTLYLLFFITLLSFWLNPYIGYRAVGFLYLMSVIIVGFKGNGKYQKGYGNVCLVA